MKLFKGWSTLEYVILAGIIVLLCLGAGLAAGLGGYFIEEELAHQADAPTWPQPQL